MALRGADNSALFLSHITLVMRTKLVQLIRTRSRETGGGLIKYDRAINLIYSFIRVQKFNL
jgi:hypothetical protein